MMNPEEIGKTITNYIQGANLLDVEQRVDEKTGDSYIMRIWSAAAYEQLGELILDMFRVWHTHNLYK